MQHFIWNINPIILEIGPLQLRWYGLLFVGSFFLGLMLMTWMYKREGKNPEELDTLLIYILIGTVVGARLMHCFAYEPSYYLSHPLEIIKIWKGGLASHGGLIGVIFALYLFSKKYHTSFLWLMSRLTIPAALAASFIRLGNFFNSEILGKASDIPWAIIFERIDMLPRHPVQLYESSAYLLLFFVLIFLYKKISPSFATKLLPGLFFFYTFTVRFLLEYTKTPQEEYSTNLLFNTGQLLSIPLILIGAIWIIWSIVTTKNPKD